MATMAIRILPPDVASQIAAGEVVERPASVVKELLENSLDAGAKVISVIVEGAGQKLIEVADDGAGIPSEDLALAVERHATSKLTQAADLFQIASLGFRGEALASIGSVSWMSMTSRTAEAETGARLRVEGGQIYPTEAVGAPVGTVVRVENLFYNLPARRKFLKSDATERRVIDNLVTRYALAYPEVRFRLVQESKPVLQTSGHGDRREVLAALYGPDAARQMQEVLYEEPALGVHGFISPPALNRPHRREMFFFVNGRPVQDASLSAALARGYHTLLMIGRFPLAVLMVTLPSEAVDVNVHPTKAEVRFREPDRVFSGVQNAVRRALLAHNPVPTLGEALNWGSSTAGGVNRSGSIFGRPSEWPSAATGSSNATHPMPFQQPGQLDWGSLEGEVDENERAPEGDAGIATDSRNQPLPFTTPNAPPSAQPSMPVPRVELLRPVGQIANAYLVAEGPDGLYLIDQHAAHERVLFERFMAQRSQKMPAQALLQPAVVELPTAAARLLEEQLPVLERLGFQVEGFGPNAFQVRAMPAIVADSNPVDVLLGLVGNFEEDEAPLQAEQEARIIARVCKRVAVKAGQSLSPEEQRALLHDLEACQAPRTCPHGRPTMIHLSVDLLERQFGRKGAR